MPSKGLSKVFFNTTIQKHPIHIAPTEITQPVSVNILEIAMIDGGTGWGIGQIPRETDKMVLRTVDGAKTWMKGRRWGRTVCGGAADFKSQAKDMVLSETLLRLGVRKCSL